MGIHAGTKLGFGYISPSIPKGLREQQFADAAKEAEQRRLARTHPKPLKEPRSNYSNAFVAAAKGDFEIRGIPMAVIAMERRITYDLLRSWLSGISRAKVKAV